MSGLAIQISFNTINQLNPIKTLNTFIDVYNNPSISYKQESLVKNGGIFYSCLPDFTEGKKIKSISNLIIAYDGDFYNIKELKDITGKKNISKIEIIYHLYNKYGKYFSKCLNGEFVIVIYDVGKRNVIVTNDRFARMPFFYYHNENEVILASEKKAILSILPEEKKIDNLGLLQVFAFRHNLSGKTFIRNIKTLQTASILSFEKAKLHRENYFEWQFKNGHLKEPRHEIIDEIYYYLIKAVSRRIHNKSRILLWLSGGYDSRAIACTIKPSKRKNVIVETCGEDHSYEVGIANKVTKNLGYRFIHRNVTLPLSSIFEIASWMTEFSVSAHGHPYLNFYKDMKKNADYIISGLPGIDTLNGKYITSKIIFSSFFNDYYDKLFNLYSIPLEILSIIFNSEFLKKYYYQLKGSFNNSMNMIDADNKLDQWDIWFTKERQTNFSHMTDLIETDLFEILHPFCDIDLLEVFLKIPVKDRIFQQLSKDMLYKYFPEIRNIDFEGGRGKLNSKNTILKYLLNSLKNRFVKYPKSEVWNINKAIKLDFININTLSNDFLKCNDELKSIFNFKEIKNIFSSPEKIIKYKGLSLHLLSFFYSYNYFIKEKTITIPYKVINHYR